MLRRCVLFAFAAMSIPCLDGQAPVGRSAGWDLGALATGEFRVGIEPVTMGRWTIQVAPSRWSDGVTPFGGRFATPVGFGTLDALSASPGQAIEWSVDVTGRWYPGSLSSAHPDRRLRTYLGAGLGLHYRQRTDIVRCSPGEGCVTPGVWERRARGVEPLAEIGLRFEPAPALMLDLGMRTRVITFEDLTNRFATGQLVPNVAFAVGVRW